MRRSQFGMLLLAGCTAFAGCTKLDGDGAEAADAAAAVGIRLASIEANQGVAVPIGRDGAGIDGPERSAALIHGRRTLLRAFWDVDEDWRPREIEAVLTLRTHEGEERSLTSTRLIAAASESSDLRRSFTWTLEAEEATPGLQYRVELFEAAPDGGDTDPDVDPPAIPAEGFSQVGLEPSRQVLDVVVVPIEREADDCVAAPDVSGERIDLMRDRLTMVLPVQALDLSVREPVVWTEPLVELDPLIDMLGELKQDDGARSEVFYYGLVGACGKVGGYSGQAHSIPVVPVPTQPWTRVAVGLSKDDAQSTVHTMVHELGHCLGRRHIACSGEENEPDESYPYRDGSIGDWGWGILDGQLRSPEVEADYMGYCKEDWVSDFGWNITFFFIRLLGRFPAEGRSAVSPVLVGSIDPDGEQRWFEAAGTVEASGVLGEVSWQTADGTVVRTPAQIGRRPHGETVNLVTRHPQTDAELVLARYALSDGRRGRVDLGALRARSR